MDWIKQHALGILITFLLGFVVWMGQTQYTNLHNELVMLREDVVELKVNVARIDESLNGNYLTASTE